MIKKVFFFGSSAMLAMSLTACNDANDNSEPVDNTPQEQTEEIPEETPEETGTETAQPEQNEANESPDNQEKSGENSTSNEADSEEDETSDEQKQMAIDTLNEIAENAKNGIVYGLSQEFIVGKSTREEVYTAIGEPQEQVGEFDYYHGSMGNASYQFAYDQQDIMKEARYFGTNVERQTNLGGITRDDLLEHIGEPIEERKIPATGELNIIYHIGDFELQFVMAEDGTTDHVNLLEKQ